MRLKVFLSYLLGVMAILGILAAPAVAGRMTVGSKVIDAMATDTAKMPDGMPCCPHIKQSVPDCQQNCPFAALCTAQCVPAINITINFLVREPVQDGSLFPRDGDGLCDQLSPSPIQRPPRI